MPFKDPEAKRAYMRKWVAEHRERLREYMRNYQRKYMPVWRAANPAKWKEIAHRSYVANKDKHLADCKKWQAKNRVQQRAYKKAYAKAWRQRNPEKARAAFLRHYPKAKLASQRWEKRNPHKRIEKDGRRRARELACTAEDCTARIAILRRERFCHWCCIFMPIGTATIDHVIPLAKGGRHCRDNLVAACHTCNSSKGQKTLSEWMEYKRKEFQEAA